MVAAPSGRRSRVCSRLGTSRTGIVEKIDSPIPVSDGWVAVDLAIRRR